MATMLLVLAALFALTVLLLVILHPFVCIFECLLSERPGLGKLGWVFFIFLGGCLIAVPYGFGGTNSVRLRSWTGRLVLTALMSFTLSIGVLVMNPDLSEQVRSLVQDSLSNTMALSSDDYDFSDLSDSDISSVFYSDSKQWGSDGTNEVGAIQSIDDFMEKIDEQLKDLDRVRESVEMETGVESPQPSSPETTSVSEHVDSDPFHSEPVDADPFVVETVDADPHQQDPFASSPFNANRAAGMPPRRSETRNENDVSRILQQQDSVQTNPFVQ